MPGIAPEEVLTMAQVAQDLQCSKSQISNLINGKVRGVLPLPVIPLGRRKLVRRSSLEGWKRANERLIPGCYAACIAPIWRRWTHQGELGATKVSER